MNIYQLPYNLDVKNISGWDLDDKTLALFPKIDDYESSVKQLRENVCSLRKISSDNLLDFFDSLVTYWVTDKESDFLRLFSNLGVSFLINFLKKSNLKSLLEISLNGNIDFLDEFIGVPSLQKKIMAHPKGVVTHWLAGNVPVLGMISLIQGIVSKNANVIKLPRENGLVLPLMAAEIAKYETSSIKGKDIMAGCMFVYCNRDDRKAQNALSVNSDLRVAWGAREAVESVMSLPRKYGTDDVIFGPKYSFAAIGKDSFNPEQLNDLAYKVAIDASTFDQQGCNCPHTVFVEKGATVSAVEFAKALASNMDKALKRIPKNPILADQAYSIVNIRSEYSFAGKVFSSKGTEWTVIYSEEKGLADACYSRIIFVRPVENLNEILDYIEYKKHQTLGLCIKESAKAKFAKEATKRGIERITELGKMTSFDYPWDGMFAINRFVRWVSLQ